MEDFRGRYISVTSTSMTEASAIQYRLLRVDNAVTVTVRQKGSQQRKRLASTGVTVFSVQLQRCRQQLARSRLSSSHLHHTNPFILHRHLPRSRCREDIKIDQDCQPIV